MTKNKDATIKDIRLSPQEIQDAIVARLTASQKLRLVSEFSGFLLKLNQLNKKDGIYTAVGKISRHSGWAKNILDKPL